MMWFCFPLVFLSLFEICKIVKSSKRKNQKAWHFDRIDICLDLLITASGFFRRANCGTVVEARTQQPRRALAKSPSQSTLCDYFFFALMNKWFSSMITHRETFLKVSWWMFTEEECILTESKSTPSVPMSVTAPIPEILRPKLNPLKYKLPRFYIWFEIWRISGEDLYSGEKIIIAQWNPLVSNTDISWKNIEVPTILYSKIRKISPFKTISSILSLNFNACL